MKNKKRVIVIMLIIIIIIVLAVISIIDKKQVQIKSESYLASRYDLSYKVVEI